MICAPAHQDVASRTYSKGVKYPLIFLYELEGKQDGAPRLDPVSEISPYAYGAVPETLDFSVLPIGASHAATSSTAASISSGAHQQSGRPAETPGSSSATTTCARRVPSIPTSRHGVGGRKRLARVVYDPTVRGSTSRSTTRVLQEGGGLPVCAHCARSWLPARLRPGCINTTEPTYNQPIAFWTSAYANRVPMCPVPWRAQLSCLFLSRCSSRRMTSGLR